MFTHHFAVIRTQLIFLLASILFLTGCNQNPETQLKKELLAYCGITMIQPMKTIARIIEHEEDCVIRISKGGSGNLYRAIKQNRIGDLYLPGSHSYMETCQAEGLVTETAHVGFNTAALIVQAGNPRGISNDPANLADSRYAVVIADPESGSIGREAKRVLETRGILEAAMKNVLFFTTDSKDITRAIKQKECDLAVNWYATSCWPENRDSMDVLLMDEKYAPRNKLVIGILKTSRHPDIAKRFLEYAAGPEGQNIFALYGFLQESDLDEPPESGD